MNANDFIQILNRNLTLLLVFPFTLLLGSYLTIKLKWVQIAFLKQSFIGLTKSHPSKKGNISRFEAVSAVLAGNFGTGNISGMAVALSTGGPGALVWMWIMAFFGAAVQYASCVLGVSYRLKRGEGEYCGGPMYYLRDGCGYRITAGLFALFTVAGAVTVGNFAQINSIVLPVHEIGLEPFLCSLGIALLSGIVIAGGIGRIGRFASYAVPFKAVLYLGTAFIILGLHPDKIMPAFRQIFREAFDFSSITGGMTGYGIFLTIKTGFDRGLFATDAGTGIVPILQAETRSDDPVSEGIATLIAPLTVMIVCTATALVLMVTGAGEIPGLQSTTMVTYAFGSGLGSPVGSYIVIGSLMLFGFTTIIAWSYCGEKAVEFLFGEKSIKYFRLFYILLIPVGALLKVDMIWICADTCIALMLIVNLIGIGKLSGKAVASTDRYRETIRSATSLSISSS